VFLGANQDSFAAGGQMSIDMGNIKNFASDNHGTRQMYATAAHATHSYMSSGGAGGGVGGSVNNFWGSGSVSDAITTSNAVVNKVSLTADDKDEDKK